MEVIIYGLGLLILAVAGKVHNQSERNRRYDAELNRERARQHEQARVANIKEQVRRERSGK